MAITSEDVLRTARLARLRITPDELPRYRADFERILDFFELIKAIDVSGIHLSNHAPITRCPLREDEVTPALNREVVLDAAPEQKAKMFRVPRIIP